MFKKCCRDHTFWISLHELLYKDLTFDGGMIEFVNKAKYVRVMLKVGRNFYFYRSFNSVFYRVVRCQNELVVGVTSYCQPYLLYCTEWMPRVTSHTDAQYRTYIAICYIAYLSHHWF